jgi:hypothetical protein
MIMLSSLKRYRDRGTGTTASQRTLLIQESKFPNLGHGIAAFDATRLDYFKNQRLSITRKVLARPAT